MLLVERNLKACYCTAGMCGLHGVCMELEGERLKYCLARPAWKGYGNVSLGIQEPEMNKDHVEKEET